jgi:uncharacterized membrane protein
MKTIPSQILVLCMSLMTTLIINSGVIPGDFVNKPSSDLIPESLLAEAHTMPSLASDSTNNSKKKRYQIIFDNKSEYKIDVAIRYKEYSGEWTTDAWISLNPGEKKIMGSSDETTYFYYAKTDSKWRKQAWSGDHKFKSDDKSLNKLKFRKQNIWECYDTEGCNTFSVFR